LYEKTGEMLKDEYFFEKNGKWNIEHFKGKENLNENIKRLSKILSHFKGEMSEIILKK
jgi:hypothetical protein